uniref:Uncharacterized protein n=1 Tax=Meleagris gallopavo TaxID=9103 RepID=A0A803Y472_MELGA
MNNCNSDQCPSSPKFWKSNCAVFSFTFLLHFCADDLSISRTAIEWSESHDRGYGNPQSVKMEDNAFNDPSLKIAFPYSATKGTVSTLLSSQR